MDIALAAVKLAHQASGGTVDEEPAEEKPAPKPKPKAEPRPVTPTKMSRIYIGAGRSSAILPQNLVGAITAEGIKGTVIGTIEMSDKYSVVELPEHADRRSPARLEERHPQREKVRLTAVCGEDLNEPTTSAPLKTPRALPAWWKPSCWNCDSEKRHALQKKGQFTLCFE